MDFSKFCDIIINNQLYFSSPTQFEDPWELYPPAKWLSKEFWIKHFEKTMKNPEAQDLKEAAESLILKIQATYQEKDSFGISCWTEGSKEKEHLWRLYGRSNNSIAIKTTVGGLLDSMISHTVSIGRVSYIQYESDSDNFYSMPLFIKGSDNKGLLVNEKQILPYMYKREDFRHEEEVRAVFWWWDVNSRIERNVSLDPSMLKIRLIDEIVISPFADSWFENVVKTFVSKTTGIHTDKIRKSTIYQRPKILEGTEDYRMKRRLALKASMEEGNVYAVFSDISAFNIWHKSVKADMAFPEFGNYSQTGGIDVGGRFTTEYTLPNQHPTNDCVIAVVSPVLAEGLELITHEEATELGWFPVPDGFSPF